MAQFWTSPTKIWLAISRAIGPNHTDSFIHMLMTAFNKLFHVSKEHCHGIEKRGHYR